MKRRILTNLGRMLLCCVLSYQAYAQNSVVALAGSSGTEVFYDIKELSDGTFLVAGSTSDLAWLQGLSANMTELDTATPADNAYAISPESGNFFQAVNPAYNLVNQRTPKRGFDNSGTGSITTNYGFLLQLNASMDTVLRGVYLPQGAATNIKFIRMTNLPGEPTGDIYISGDIKYNLSKRNSGYFLAKLNGNFVNQVPTGFQWVRSIYGDRNEKNPQQIISSLNQFNTQFVYFNHPWDVNKQGKVIFVAGQYRQHPDNNTSVQYAEEFGLMSVLEPNGYYGYMPGWPVQRYKYYNDNRNNLNRQRFEYEAYFGDGFHFPNSIADYGDTSVIRFSEYYFKWENKRPSNRRHILRSFSDQGVNKEFDDGNGRLRKGTYPLDAYFDIGSDTVIQPLLNPDGKTYFSYVTGEQTSNDVGYLGAQFSTDPSGRVYVPSAILFDKQTGDYYVAGSHSYNNGLLGTFVPYVMCMDSLGRLKWFSRLYSETDANGSPQLANTNYHVNGLAMDYTNGQLVVTAYSDGKDALNNLWEGDAVKDLELAVTTDTTLIRMNGNNNKVQGWQNKITGSQLNNRFSWIGKLDRNGKLKHSTYVAELADASTASNLLGSGNLNGFPSFNQGNPDLATTRIANQSVQVGADGSVMILAKTLGGIPMVTANAYQQYPLSNGATNMEFVRIYAPDLTRPIYSSVLGTGSVASAAPSSISAMNALRTSKGVVVVGAVNAGNDLVTANVPTWGKSTTADGNDAFLAHLQPSCYVKAAFVFKKTGCAVGANPGSGLLTLTNTSTTVSGTASYAWYVAPLAGSYGATPDATTKDFVLDRVAGDYKVKLVVTDGVATCKDSIEQQITAPLRLKAGISTDLEQAVGVPFNLTSSSLYNNPITTQPPANLTYKWVYPRTTGVDTFVVAGSGRAVTVNGVTVNVAGTYQVALYITDVTSGNTCIDSAKVSLTVLPVPILSFDTTRLASGCSATRFRLTNTSQNIPSSNRFVFQNIVGSTPVSTDTLNTVSQKIEYDVSGSGKFRLTRIDALGNVLGSPIEINYNTPVVTPTGSYFTITPSRKEFLLGETGVTLNNLAYPSLGLDSVIWYITRNGNPHLTAKRVPSDVDFSNFVFSTSQIGNYTIKLTAYRNSGNCVQDTTMTGVVVDCPDSLVTLFNNTDTTVLVGAPVIGMARPAFPSFVAPVNRSITWTNFDGSTQTASTTSPSNRHDSLNTVGVDTLSVRAVSFGCIVTKQIRVTATCPDSLADITTADMTVIPGQPITIVGSVKIPSIANVFSADTTNLTGASSILMNGSFTINHIAPSAPGDYFVKVRANAHACVIRDSVKVTVQACPNPLASVLASKTVTVVGDTISFKPTFLVSGYESATTYTWMRFNGTTQTKPLTDTLVDMLTNGLDTVSLMVQTHTCVDTVRSIVSGIIPSFDTTRVPTGCGSAFEITNTSQNHTSGFKYVFEVVGAPDKRDTLSTLTEKPIYEVEANGTIRLTVLNAANQPVGNTFERNFNMESEPIGAFFTLNPARTQFITGETVTLENKAYPATGLQSVRWAVIRDGVDSTVNTINFGDANFNNFPVMFSQSGNYTIRMRASRNGGACLRDTVMTGIVVACPDTLISITNNDTTVLAGAPVMVNNKLSYPSFLSPSNVVVNWTRISGASVSASSSVASSITDSLNTVGNGKVYFTATAFGSCVVKDSMMITTVCPDSIATVTSSKSLNVLPGEPFNVSIAVRFPMGSTSNSAILTNVVGGTQSVSTGTSNFNYTAPITSGSYFVKIAGTSHACVIRDSATITVQNCPDTIATFSGVTNVLPGEVATFTPEFKLGTTYQSATTYSWIRFSGSTVSKSLTDTLQDVISTERTDTVYLAAQTYGCVDTVFLPVTASCSGVVSDITGGAPSARRGQTVTFTDNSTVPSAFTATRTYSTVSPATITQSGAFTSNTDGTYKAYLEISVLGCTKKDSAEIVVSCPAVVATIVKSADSLVGSTVSFSNSAANATLATNTWSFGDAANSTASGSTVSFAYSTAGTYMVKLNVSLDACTGSDSTQVKIVAPVSGATCTTFKPRLFVAGNLITTSVFGNNDAIKWFYVPFDTTVKTSLVPAKDSFALPFTSQTISADRFGYYYSVITVNALSGCIAKSDLAPIANPAAGLTNDELTSSVVVYPTMGVDKVTVSIANNYIGEGMIQVYDNTGRLLQSIGVSKDGNLVEKVVSLENLPSGLYNIVITLDGATTTKKVQR